MPGEDIWGEIGLRRLPSSTSVGNVLCHNKFGRLCCTAGRRKSSRADVVSEGLDVNRRKPFPNHHLAPVLRPFVGFPARRGNSTWRYSNRRKSFLLGNLLATEPARGENVAAKGAWSFRFAPVERGVQDGPGVGATRSAPAAVGRSQSWLRLCGVMLRDDRRITVASGWLGSDCEERAGSPQIVCNWGLVARSSQLDPSHPPGLALTASSRRPSFCQGKP